MKRLSREQLKQIALPLLYWYYEQANMRHNDLVRVESLITERGYTLFAIYFGILSAAVGYVLTHLDIKDDAALTAGCLSLIVFTSISIGYICKVIWPHVFFAPGKMPDAYGIPQYIAYFSGNQVDEEEQQKQIISDELVELQRKASGQEQENKKRVKQTQCSIAFLLFGTFMAVLSFLSALIIY